MEKLPRFMYGERNGLDYLPNSWAWSIVKRVKAYSGANSIRKRAMQRVGGAYEAQDSAERKAGELVGSVSRLEEEVRQKDGIITEISNNLRDERLKRGEIVKTEVLKYAQKIAKQLEGYETAQRARVGEILIGRFSRLPAEELESHAGQRLILSTVLTLAEKRNPEVAKAPIRIYYGANTIYEGSSFGIVCGLGDSEILGIIDDAKPHVEKGRDYSLQRNGYELTISPFVDCHGIYAMSVCAVPAKEKGKKRARKIFRGLSQRARNFLDRELTAFRMGAEHATG